MIKRIQVLNYRCLRYIDRDLDNFNVLIGPNASGKTTFLDCVSFVGDLLSDGLEQAINKRTSDYRDLVWLRQSKSFQIAIEVEIPKERKTNVSPDTCTRCRYEIEIGSDIYGTTAILHEKVLLLADQPLQSIQIDIFPFLHSAPSTILTTRGKKGTKTIINKVLDGNDNFYDETGKGWDHSFKLGNRKSALANLPEDESRFPVSTWLKSILMDGVQNLVLNSILMRKPSKPGQPKGFRPDGSNLPWVIHDLIANHPGNFEQWIMHLKTALPDIKTVKIIERPEDRNRYLVVCYNSGLEVPSWMVSDGTLRLMALTLLTYVPDFRGIYLVEEPENGIHPRAIETAFQSLSSIYEGQILLATHSPVILSIAEPKQILCFAKTKEGATDVIGGDKHPALKEWRGEVNLSVLFAGGVLS